MPADAWADWDPVAAALYHGRREVPRGRVRPCARASSTTPTTFTRRSSGTTAAAFSVADIIMNMILTFDRGKPESPIFDPSEQPVLEAFLRSFKGVRIVSTHPLVIETYSDTYFLDAELNVCRLVPDLPPRSGRLAQPRLLGIRAESQRRARLLDRQGRPAQRRVDELHRRSEPGDLGAAPQEARAEQSHSLRRRRSASSSAPTRRKPGGTTSPIGTTKRGTSGSAPVRSTSSEPIRSRRSST